MNNQNHFGIGDNIGRDKFNINVEKNDGIINIGNIEKLHYKTLEEAIKEWQSQTGKRLVPDLVLTSRENEIQKLFEYLNESPSKIVVISEKGKEDSYGFVVNSLDKFENFKEKVRIINNQNDWDQTIKQKDLILIYKNFVPNNIGLAIENENFVIETEEREFAIQKNEKVIKLPKIRKDKLINILQKMGLIYEKSWQVIEDSKGYLHLMIFHPLLEPREKFIPKWIDEYNIDFLITLFFVNSWSINDENDKKIIEKLSNINYEDFEKKLYELKEEENSPVRLILNEWQLISKLTFSDLLISKITPIHIKKLKEVAFEVFTEIDPALELEPNERWSATIYGKTMKYSNNLRQSLADSLALISCFGNDKLIKEVNDILKQVFQNDLSYKSWYSYHQELILLAEASPKNFLVYLIKSLDHNLKGFEELFIDDGIFEDCYYCNLLWALETVSWNNKYVIDVIEILLKLSKIENKSRLVNNPFNTLKHIFLGRISYSCLTNKDKIQILENIILKKDFEIGWNLLFELLPHSNEIASPIHKPKYQDWVCENDKVLQKDYLEYCNAINKLIYENIKDNNVLHWIKIFENIENFTDEYIIKLIDKFLLVNKNFFSDDEKLSLSNIIRQKIHLHKKHPDAYWSMEIELIKKLENTYYSIKFNNLIYKYLYLFKMGEIELLNPIPYKQETFEDDYKKEKENIFNLQKKVIQEIITFLSTNGLIEFIKKVEDSFLVGSILFEVYQKKFFKLMLKYIDSDDLKLKQCAEGYFSRYVRNYEISFEELEENKIISILLIMPFNSKTFEILKKQSDIINEKYWKEVKWYYGLEKRDLLYTNWIIEQFNKYELNCKAINFVSHMLHSRKEANFDIELLFKVLVDIEPNNEKINYYNVAQIIKFLQSTNLDENKKRVIEWKFLQIDRFRPISWEKFISNNPKLFVELISLIYKVENEKYKELEKEVDKNISLNAYELLKKIELDLNLITDLKSWLLLIQDELKKVCREKIGNIELGKILGKMTKEKNGIFPQSEICEIFEECANQYLEQGFIDSIIYPNGIRFTSKSLYEGGKEEYKLSEKYKMYAEKIKFTYPNMSKILRRISEIYLNEAKREDLESDL